MPAPAQRPMTFDEFLIFAEGRSGKWELIDGVPFAMSPERVAHGDMKYRVARALDEAIRRAGLACRFVLDSAAVKIDAQNSFQPDVMVYCGAPVSPDALHIENPIIVVEVLSPGNARRDLCDKLDGYFKVASVRHYLIFDPDEPLVIHHQRHGGDILTRILRSGAITLDPPGIEVTMADFYGAGT